MVDGYLGKLTEQRMLIHLFDNILQLINGSACCINSSWNFAAVHVQRKHVPRTLKRLEKAKELLFATDMSGAKQRRKVYLVYYWKTRAKLSSVNFATMVNCEGKSIQIREIPKNNRRILEVPH